MYKKPSIVEDIDFTNSPQKSISICLYDDLQEQNLIMSLYEGVHLYCSSLGGHLFGLKNHDKVIWKDDFDQN